MSKWLKYYSPAEIKRACLTYVDHLSNVAVNALIAPISLAYDGAKWITVHPNGKGYNNNGDKIKGRPVLIDEESGEVLGGAGGKFNGKHISEMPQRGANALKSQHDITRVQQKRSDPEGFAKRQQELIAKRDQQLKQAQEAAAKVKAEAERKAKEAQEQQAKEQTAAQQTQAQAPVTSRQAEAQRYVQLVQANPVPAQFDSYEAVSDYCSKAIPFFTTGAFQHMTLKSACGLLQGVTKMVEKFPGLIEKGLAGFTNQDALHAEFKQNVKKYKATIKKQVAAIRKDKQAMQEIQAETDQLMAKKMDAFKNDKNWGDKGGAIGHLYPTDWDDTTKNNKVLKAISAIRRGRIFESEFTDEEIAAIADLSAQSELERLIYKKAAEQAAERGITCPVEEKDEYPHYFAYFYPQANQSKPRIWFGANFFGDKKLAAAFDLPYNRCKDGWFVPVDKDVSNETALCVHEMAHSLDYALGEASGQDCAYLSDRDPVIQQAFSDFTKEMTAKGKGKKDIYALTNPHEFVAEQITEAMLNSEASERAKLVFDRVVALHDNMLRS